MQRRSGIPRRVILRSACTGLALLCAGSAAGAQGKKYTLQEAEYRDEAEDDLRCIHCALFVDPDQCNIIDGKVSPNGTCKYFVPVE